MSKFRRWHALKHGAGAAARIVEQLEQSGLETVMLDGVRPVEAAIRYFRARLERMDYAGARRQGLPIGSGNVEATCKSLVTVRTVEANDRRGRSCSCPLAKPVQIAVARTAPITSGNGARRRRIHGREARNGSDEDRRRNAGPRGVDPIL